MISEQDQRHYLAIARRAAAEAAEVIRTHGPGRLTEKGDRDPASEVDLAVERNVRDFLHNKTPEVEFLGEEEGGQPLPNLLIPEDAVRAAGELVSREHFVPVHARQSAFTVPMAWFSLFNAQDHTESFHHGNRVHRCAVPVDLATRRVVRAAQVVEDAGGEDLEDLAEDLTHLGRWLGAFSANSLVVLHYGSLADPFQPDESPQDFSDAVELLAAQDAHGAAVAFRRLMHRWLPLAHLESAS